MAAASGSNALSLMDSRMNLTDFLDRLSSTHEAEELPGAPLDSDPRRAFLKDLATLEDQWKSCSAGADMTLSEFIEAAVKENNDGSKPAEASTSAVGKVGRDAAVKLLRTFGSLNSKCQSLFSEEFGVDEFIRSLQSDHGTSSSHDNGNPFADSRRPGSGPGSPSVPSPGGRASRSLRPGAVPVGAPARPPPSVPLPAATPSTIQLIRTLSSFHKQPGAQPYLEGGVAGLPADGLPRTRSQKARVARHHRRQKRAQQRDQQRRRELSDGGESGETRIPRQASLLAQDRWRTQMHFRDSSAPAPAPASSAPAALASSAPAPRASAPRAGGTANTSASTSPTPLPAAPAPSGRGKRARPPTPEIPEQEEVNLDEMDEKKRKKWICMLRNRESAARDRARKKEHLKTLEERIGQLEAENAALRRRVAELEGAASGGAAPAAGRVKRTASGRVVK